MPMNIMPKTIFLFKTNTRKGRDYLSKIGKQRKIDYNMKIIKRNMMTGEQKKKDQ